ncbi:MAG: hypothetical protein KKH94_05190 [Candidatus Omnitrophica bacterium]|nr:hypothetical protein [Candidatus Omnitrophota bacterium]
MNKVVECVLEKLSYDVFTDRDIAVLFAGSCNRRYALMKRAMQSGNILRLKKGVYCLEKKYQRHGLNMWHLAQLLYGPSYVSLESSLSYHGWIPEGVFMTTCVSIKRSVNYKTPLGRFAYHHIPQNSFYAEVERVVTGEEIYFMARPLKALCDYVYVHKKKWRSVAPLIESLRIDEDLIAQVTPEEYDSVYDNYRGERLRSFILGMRKEMQV